MPPLFALVDCNNFYVSCERLFRPDLRTSPIVVLSNNDGCVISRSEEAKALGIPMGAPWFTLRELEKRHHMAVFSSNYALYGELSARVMNILRDLSPRLEVYSIDECFLDMSGLGARVAEHACRIRADIQRLVGLPVSVGVGPNKTLAKLANQWAKKHTRSGVAVLGNEQQREYLLRQASVGGVWGIGRRLRHNLEARGVKNAWELSHQDVGTLRRCFGVTLEKTLRELRGECCFALEEGGPAPRQMILCSRSFPRRVEVLATLQEAVACHASRAGEKLRRQGSLCRMVQVSLYGGGADAPHWHAVTVPLPAASDDSRDLVRAAVAGADHLFRPGTRYHKAGVTLLDILAPSSCQEDFFQPPPRPDGQALMHALDQINTRLGRGTVRLGRIPARPEWAMRQERRSPHYLCRWSDIPRALS